MVFKSLKRLYHLKGLDFKNDKAIICLEKIKYKCAKMHVFENTKIWDVAKSLYFWASNPEFVSHPDSRDTESNHLKKKNKIGQKHYSI